MFEIIKFGLCFFSKVQLLVSDSDVESYKQIKSDLDVLRQSVEKSELWVYKSRGGEENGKKVSTKEEEDDVAGDGTASIAEKQSLSKQGSAMDLDIGPPIHTDQADEYKKIQQVCVLLVLEYNNTRI